MSNADGKFASWEPPMGGGHSGAPLEPLDKVWLTLKLATVGGIETFNWALHTANYSLVNPVGNDVFLADVLGVPFPSGLENITVGICINGLLGLAAVLTPVFLFGQLLERSNELFSDPRSFFRNGLNTVVTVLLLVVYGFVIVTEAMALFLRVGIESSSSLIPDLVTHPTGYWPMLLMSLSLIAVNAAMGLATAHIVRSTKRALKGV